MLDQSSHWMVLCRSVEPLDTRSVVTVYNHVSRMLTLPLHDLESFWFAAWSPASLSSLGLLCLLSQVLFVDFSFLLFPFLWSLGGLVLEVGAGCAGSGHTCSPAPTSSFFLFDLCVFPPFPFCLTSFLFLCFLQFLCSFSVPFLLSCHFSKPLIKIL